MRIYEEIKERLTMAQVIQRYGFEVNRSGFVSCPFHNEKTASMKIYDKSFYCFGCGAGGDVIKFTSMLFNLSNSQAAIKLDNDFYLKLTDREPDREAERKYRSEKAEKERMFREYRTDYMKKCDEFKALRKICETSKNFEEIAKAQARLEYLDYWFSENAWR